MARTIGQTAATALAVALLCGGSACRAPGGGVGDGADSGRYPTSDSGASGPAVRTWLYASNVTDYELEYLDGEGEPVARVQGYGWGGQVLGPALVADLGDDVLFTVSNQVTQRFDVELEGVEAVDVPPVAASSGGTLERSHLRVSANLEAGVFAWRGSAEGVDEGRHGMMGLLVVRDPAEIAGVDLDEQANLVLLDLAEDAEHDACPGAEEPCWEAGRGPYDTVIVGQSLPLNPVHFRAPQTQNEYITYEVGRNREIRFDAGSDVRLNLLSESDTPHTLSLGGLLWTEPGTGEAQDRILLEPGEGTHVLWRGIEPVGAYVVQCMDHDHAGAAKLIIVVE